MTEHEIAESDSLSKVSYVSGPSYIVTVADLAPSRFTINDPDGKMLVSIHLKDGSIEHGESYTPSAAAQAFWAAISSEYRDYLQQKHG